MKLRLGDDKELEYMNSKEVQEIEDALDIALLGTDMESEEAAVFEEALSCQPNDLRSR